MKKVFALIALGSTSVFAQNPWVECGVGGAVATLFPDKKAANIVAIASNIVWDLGTTATSSALSSPDMCANPAAAAAKLIHETYESVVAETAIGSGENLSALLDLVDVDTDQRAAVISALRSDLSSSLSAPGFVEMTHTEKAQAYYYSFMRVTSAKS